MTTLNQAIANAPTEPVLLGSPAPLKTSSATHKISKPSWVSDEEWAQWQKTASGFPGDYRPIEERRANPLY